LARPTDKAPPRPLCLLSTRADNPFKGTKNVFRRYAAEAQNPRNFSVEFEFDTTLVRTIAMEGRAWFVATDVCDILDSGDLNKAGVRLLSYR